MRPTWGPHAADRTQVGHMLAPWTLLTGVFNILWSSAITKRVHRYMFDYDWSIWRGHLISVSDCKFNCLLFKHYRLFQFAPSFVNEKTSTCANSIKVMWTEMLTIPDQHYTIGHQGKTSLMHIFKRYFLIESCIDGALEINSDRESMRIYWKYYLLSLNWGRVKRHMSYIWNQKALVYSIFSLFHQGWYW